MTSPRLIIETEVVQYGRRKPTTLKLDLDACRQAMAGLARAERILLAATAAADEPAQDDAAVLAEDDERDLSRVSASRPVHPAQGGTPPRNQGPVCACGHQLGAHYASGLCSVGPCLCREPHGTIAVGLGQAADRCPDCGESALRCQCGGEFWAEPDSDADADGDGGPAPRRAGPGEPRCEAYDDVDGEGWLCSAQPGHGGPDHLAYAHDGTVAHRWPAAAARPQGQDPYDPEAMSPCRCSHATTEHSIRLIDRSRGSCTSGCGCIRYEPRPPLALAATAGAGSLPAAREP